MPQASIAELLDRNDAHVEDLARSGTQLPEDQRPPVVSVCCSDSRVSQEGMWSVDEPGWLFSYGAIGNQAWDHVDGDPVVAGSLVYPLQATGTKTALVVGHTGCGAIAAALDAHEGDRPSIPGLKASIEPLVPIVEEAFREDLVDPEEPRDQTWNKLVEANVHAQVDFLLHRDEVPDDVDVLGFVYDLTGAYDGPQGRSYLVNANGTRDPKALRDLAGSNGDHVATLLR